MPKGVHDSAVRGRYDRTVEHRAAQAVRLTTHGLSRTTTYNSWYAMKQRCNNSNNRMYPQYGGRGVTVCERWLHSFENFLADMGEKPSREYSLDRIDSNGNYEPGNCRWATHTQQALNRTQRGKDNARRKITQTDVDWIRSGGDGLSHREMAEHLGVSRAAVSHVVQGRSWV